MTTSPPLSPDSPRFQQIQRHGRFYIAGADLTVLSGNVLFRVHRFFFERESRVFREQFLPASEATSDAGYSDSTAIAIDVPAEDFAKLLGLFYNPRYSLYDLSLSDWTCILSLAHKWEFKEVKKLALRELKSYELGVVERIALYERYEADAAVLVPLYAALCSRAELLSDEEADALGSRTTIRVYRARERLRAQPPDMDRSPLPKGIESTEIYDTLSAVFGVPWPVYTPDEDEQVKWTV